MLPRDELWSKEMDWVPGHHQTILDFTRCVAPAVASHDQGVGLDDIPFGTAEPRLMT